MASHQAPGRSGLYGTHLSLILQHGIIATLRLVTTGKAITDGDSGDECKHQDVIEVTWLSVTLALHHCLLEVTWYKQTAFS